MTGQPQLSRSRIQRFKIQAYPNKKQNKIMLGGMLNVYKYIIIEFGGIVVK